MESLMDSIRGMMSDTVSGEHIWMFEVFVVVFATLVAALMVARVLRKINKHAAKTKTLWDDAFFSSIERPAKWFVWGMGLASAATIAGQHSPSIILQSVPHARYLGAVGIITWMILGFVSRAERNFMSAEYCQKPMDQTTASALGKLVRISVIITTSLIVLQYFDVQVSGILAFGGIGGIAVGFAAKDLLANFFGGLMIYLDRPFTVGDWVRSPDKQIEGTVEDIGWRLTRIRTFDKRPLYIPNATFTQIGVENPSRMTNRRIYERVGIRYDDANKMSAIVADVKIMLRAHEEIEQKQTLMVNFNSFESSSLEFFVYCFTQTTDWVQFHEIKQDVLLKILKVIDSHEAECAFPTSTVHMPEGLRIDAPISSTGVR